MLDKLARLNPTRRQRRYIYRVAVALGVLAAGYGFVSEHELVLWLGLVNAALGGLADANVDAAPVDEHDLDR